MNCDGLSSVLMLHVTAVHFKVNCCWFSFTDVDVDGANFVLSNFEASQQTDLRGLFSRDNCKNPHRTFSLGFRCKNLQQRFVWLFRANLRLSVETAHEMVISTRAVIFINASDSIYLPPIARKISSRNKGKMCVVLLITARTDHVLWSWHSNALLAFAFFFFFCFSMFRVSFTANDPNTNKCPRATASERVKERWTESKEKQISQIPLAG